MGRKQRPCRGTNAAMSLAERNPALTGRRYLRPWSMRSWDSGPSPLSPAGGRIPRVAWARKRDYRKKVRERLMVAQIPGGRGRVRPQDQGTSRARKGHRQCLAKLNPALTGGRYHRPWSMRSWESEPSLLSVTGGRIPKIAWTMGDGSGTGLSRRYRGAVSVLEWRLRWQGVSSRAERPTSHPALSGCRRDRA